MKRLLLEHCYGQSELLALITQCLATCWNTEDQSQFRCGFEIMRMRKKSPNTNPGTARTRSATTANRLCPEERSQRLPPKTPPRTNRMVIHNPALNDDTEPSANPTKKKYKTTTATNASNPQRAQNFTGGLLLAASFIKISKMWNIDRRTNFQLMQVDVTTHPRVR
jgi:hypothetical protein